MFLDGVLVDDKNMPGETLGLRRMQTPFKTLLKLNRAAMGPTDLIRSPSGPYIDSKGKVFFYEKTQFCKVKYHKIKSVVKRGKYSNLFLHGISFPFAIPRPPEDEYVWAGVLYITDVPWRLYDFSTERLKTYRRKV